MEPPIRTGKGAEKAYVLLREALRRSNRAAIARFVFKQHEHLGVIRPQNDLLILQELRYASELLDSKDLAIPKKAPVDAREIKIALELIDSLTKHFHPSDFFDTYTEDLKAIMKKKAHGQKAPIKKHAAAHEQKTQNIMSLLQKSLKNYQKKKRSAA